MGQQQITLEDVYEKVSKIEIFMSKMDQYLEDLEFARRTEEAYQRHEAGDFIELDEKEFLKEMKKW